MTGFPKFDKEEAAGEMELSPDSQGCLSGTEDWGAEGDTQSIHH